LSYQNTLQLPGIGALFEIALGAVFDIPPIDHRETFPFSAFFFLPLGGAGVQWTENAIPMTKGTIRTLSIGLVYSGII
jgi:hypothetical protein